MILICAMLLPAGMTMSSFSALAGGDKTMDVKCNPGYSWNGTACVPDEQPNRGNVKDGARDVNCDPGYRWDVEIKRCVRREQR